MSVFHELHPRLKEVLNELGYEKPTAVQDQSIPLVLEGKNVLIISETGSGKTESVLFPVINALLERLERGNHLEGIFAIYVTPLRALNRDMFSRMIQFGKRLGIQIEIRHGDTSQNTRRKQVKNPPQVLITTPETLQILLVAPRMKYHLHHVKYVILDEIHSIAGSKRGFQLRFGLHRLQRITREQFQVIMLSATIANPFEIGSFFITKGQDLYVVDATQEKPLELTIRYVPEDETPVTVKSKSFIDRILQEVQSELKNHKQVLIFTNTRQFAETLGAHLTAILSKKEVVHVHHGSLTAEERIESEKRFKKGEIKALVCTSSLELGLDIGLVDAVIQMFSSRQVTPLLQRIGRSGHSIDGKRKGILIAFGIMDLAAILSIVKHLLEKKIEPIKLWRSSYDIYLHQILGLLMEEEVLEISDLHKFFYGLKPQIQITDEILDELIMYGKSLGLIWVEGNRISRRRKTRSFYYEHISTIYDVKKYYVKDLASQKFIASLDDRFVETVVEPGMQVIIKGRPWLVEKIEGDTVEVAPGALNESVQVPSWIGELLPVPSFIAQGVKTLFSEHDTKFEEFIKTKVKVLINNEEQFGIIHMFPQLLRSTSEVVIEWKQGTVMLHSFLGSQGNETLVHVFSVLFLLRTKKTPSFSSNAFTIVLQSRNEEEGIRFIKQVLNETDPSGLKALLEMTIDESDLFLFVFKKIATKMGVIESNAEVTPHRLRVLARSMKGTIVHKETINSIFQEEFDLEVVQGFLYDIQKGKLKIRSHQQKGEWSPLGKYAIRDRLSDLFSDAYPKEEIIRLVKKRLLNTKLRFACLRCGKFDSIRTVKSIRFPFKCPHCNSMLLGVTHPHNDKMAVIIRKKIRGEQLSPEEKAILNQARLSASLLAQSKERAILALAGKGVGPKTAARIIQNAYSSSEEDFISKIIKEEQNYVRTRAFWS